MEVGDAGFGEVGRSGVGGGSVIMMREEKVGSDGVEDEGEWRLSTVMVNW